MTSELCQPAYTLHSDVFVIHMYILFSIPAFVVDIISNIPVYLHHPHGHVICISFILCKAMHLTSDT